MAIVGLGTDIVEICRIEQSLQRSPRLVQRVLSESEQLIFASHAQPARYFAKRFAAKEAIGKALGVGLFYPMSLHAVEILNDAKGAPKAAARNRLADYLRDKGYQIHVSISDEIENAQALAIVETA